MVDGTLTGRSGHDREQRMDGPISWAGHCIAAGRGSPYATVTNLVRATKRTKEII
jgi:hypothetical protein